MSKRDDDFIINSFIAYMMTHPEEDPFSDKYVPTQRVSYDSGCLDKLIEWAFIGALIFIAVASPIVLILSLIMGVEQDGLWVLILVTLADIGVFIWWRVKKAREREAAALADETAPEDNTPEPDDTPEDEV